jgi:hypothetical protein
LGILYLINGCTSDGQHKEPQQQQQWGNNGENNQNVNPLPPPPPTLEQVLAMQAQMLQTMQQTMFNMQAAQPQALPPPSRDRLGDFQRTKPPIFSHAMEPMDADDWLKYVEKKLQVL